MRGDFRESWQFLGNSSEIYAHTFYKIFVNDVLPPPCENKGWKEKEGLRMMICRASTSKEVEILLKGWHYSFPRGLNENTERKERVKNIVVFLGSFDGTKEGLENSFDHFPRNFFHSPFRRR